VGRALLEGGPAHDATPAAVPTAPRQPFDLFHYTFSISLEPEVISRIRRPTLITDPASSSGPGSRSALDCPEQLMRFTAVEGADSHCEPKAPVLRNQRVLDWLDDTL
jgi:hypothetical protein